MIISRNIKIKHQLHDHEYQITIVSPELDKIYCKYDGLVHIQIKKPQDAKTEAQRRTFHALLSAYYQTGMHSSPDGTSLETFKRNIKYAYGPSWEETYKGKTYTTLKNTEDYTKEEYSNIINCLLREIEQAGAMSDKKIQEIVQGMADNALLQGHA